MDLASSLSPALHSPLARLRKLATPRARQEHCELCHCVIAADHQHLLELESRQLVCACEACAILFSSEHVKRYRRVPRRVRLLADFQLSDETWESLHIPINLAFFYHNSTAGKMIAMYPSPAGATESLLPMDAWTQLAADNPILARMEGDVEALLLNRIGHRRDALLVPIDACYRLVGEIRSHWRGLSGGKEVWDRIDRFFHELHRKGEGRPSHA